ncbi:hypothetical protein CYMTET_27468 [Cymbomonas tetramitiformis]|uniref:Uncharacterized protein n=1 Tax=Cymbomonas tetramitiformis TaxID=36881 RepID=A0AAE0KX64_9CHLO|nr:hypothetical protein CYMTET_27468 [Cymbomonas tetramitiformis]
MLFPSDPRPWNQIGPPMFDFDCSKTCDALPEQYSSPCCEQLDTVPPHFHTSTARWRILGALAPGSGYLLEAPWEQGHSTSAEANERAQPTLGKLSCLPLEGGRFSAHSSRECACTCARAARVLLTRCCFLGGWSQLSSVIRFYIDPAAVLDQHMEKYSECSCFEGGDGSELANCFEGGENGASWRTASRGGGDGAVWRNCLRWGRTERATTASRGRTERAGELLRGGARERAANCSSGGD